MSRSPRPSGPDFAQLVSAMTALERRVATLEARWQEDVAGVVASGNRLSAEFERLAQLVTSLQESVGRQGSSGSGWKQRFKVQAPKKFSEADGTRTIVPWLLGLRVYVEHCDYQPTAAQLASYLDGPALNAYLSHQMNCGPDDVVHDLDSFERVMKKLMNLGNQPEVARQKMKLLKQGAMHIAEYNSTFGALASECPDRSDFDKVGDYIDGLNDDIRRDVKMHGCATLGDAMQKAVAASGIVTAAGGTGGAVTSVTPMEIDNAKLEAALHAVLGERERRTDRGERPNVKCWNCKNYGHFERDCPHPSRGGDRGGSRRGGRT